MLPDFVKLVPMLYEAKKLKPDSGHSDVIFGACCALGILAIDRPKGQSCRDYLGLTHHEAYTFGTAFDRGFEGRESFQHDDVMCKLGYEIGVECARHKWV